MQTHSLKLKRWLAGLLCLAALFTVAACTPSAPPLMKSLDTTDWDALHSALPGKSNKYLILGNLQITQASVKMDPELEVFLGRWEGYSYSPPSKRERKFVLVVQDIGLTGGNAVYWAGENLQYPDVTGRVRFRIVPGRPIGIEWQVAWPDGTKTNETYRYVGKKDELEGWSHDAVSNRATGPYQLNHNQNFTIYKDYPQYLSGKGIYANTYNDPSLNNYGTGYLYYLPDTYQTNTLKSWPLLIYLHDTVDRGDIIYGLARSSPFVYLREVGPLPMIIVAPLLSAKPGLDSFPAAYLDGVLAEVRARYRVNPSRIYVTGLGMGGEATWRFALQKPDTFAAIAPFGAYLNPVDPQSMKAISGLPVWAMHGGNDSLVPVEHGRQPAQALNALGGQARFTVLVGRDHDIGIEMYADPTFYGWLLDHYRHTAPAP